MSKFIDLKELKVHKVYDYLVYGADLGDAEELLSQSAINLKETIELELNFNPEDAEYEAIMFDVTVDNCQTPEDFEYLVNFIVDHIFNLLTTNEPREREHRYAAPKNLRNYVNCNNVPLQKAVNNKTIVDIFTIHIHDNKTNWEFDLINEQ